MSAQSSRQFAIANDDTDVQHAQQGSPADRSNAKDRRASRACLACRARKSRCDLIPGQPVCRRCRQEQKECILTVSRRGGRRVRRSALPTGDDPVPTGDASQNHHQRGPSSSGEDEDGSIAPEAPPSRDLREDQASWSQLPSCPPGGIQSQYSARIPPRSPSSLPATANTTSRPRRTTDETHGHNVDATTQGAPGDWAELPWAQDDPPQKQAQEPQPERQSRSSPEDNIDSHITSADLINPSDALDLLAQVAQRSGEEERANDTQESRTEHRDADFGNDDNGPEQHPESVDSLDYPPIANGQVTLVEARRLLKLYEQKYHHFFPVAHHAIFAEDIDISVLARDEPFLLSAVLTIASKNEPSASKAFAACSAHVEVLISNVIYCGSASVGAVEALLILAEWPPQRLQSKRSIGRGEEDQGAWMQVGCAIRLGYLQRLEQTALYPGRLADSKNTHRKRLVWTACYMSDRQISGRLGKGFWSRGAGPSTILQAADFPTLRPKSAAEDDLSMLFMAHFALTQLFSNAHDILYSSSMHREHLYSGGEYIRYIDDFASMLRNWKLLWGSLSFSPHVKATLVLSYDYLRLYIHAFAFQAEMYRASKRARRENPTSNPRSSSFKLGPLFTNVAASPDARFIYESIDAANSLLSTLNSFIDPVAGLRYMPLKYYLYIIYAAVFLFKARLAEAITADGEEGVRRTIAVTVDRLQKSATNRESPGYRYARLVHQLWLKPRSREGTVTSGLGGISSMSSRRTRLRTSVVTNIHDPSRGSLGAGQNTQGSILGNQNSSSRRDGQHPTQHSSSGTRNVTQSNKRVSIADDPSRLLPARAASSSSTARGSPSLASPPNAFDFDALMNDFSWRDLNAVGEFVNNENPSTTESVLPSPDWDQRLAAAEAADIGGNGGIYDMSMPPGSARVSVGAGGGGGEMGEAAQDWISSWMGTDVIF